MHSVRSFVVVDKAKLIIGKGGGSVICWKRTEYKNNIIHSVGLKSWQLLFKNVADMVFIILKFRITAFSSVSLSAAGISGCQHLGILQPSSVVRMFLQIGIFYVYLLIDRL